MRCCKDSTVRNVADSRLVVEMAFVFSKVMEKVRILGLFIVFIFLPPTTLISFSLQEIISRYLIPIILLIRQIKNHDEIPHPTRIGNTRRAHCSIRKLTAFSIFTPLNCTEHCVVCVLPSI